MMRRFQVAAEEQVQVTSEMEKQAQVELHVPLACLEEANAALLLIEKRHIVEIKSFNSPPLLVHLVLDAICVVFSMEPTWENARRILSGSNIVQNMLSYDKDAMADEILGKLESHYISDERFHRGEVEKQSLAASMMVIWVRAIYQYASARRVVKPTLDKLEKAQARLRLLMQEYQVSKQRVADADEELLKLKTSLETALELKRKTTQEIESREARLESGLLALEFLSENKTRMEKVVDDVTKSRYHGLTWWDALLAAGLITYAGRFHARDRRKLFCEWEQAYWRSTTTDRDRVETKCLYLPSLHVALREKRGINDGGNDSDQDEEDIMDLFLPDSQQEDCQHWQLVSAGGVCFSQRRLQDAFFLSELNAAGGFPTVLITNYTHEIEELLLKFARNLWKWTEFFMVSAKSDDFCESLLSAVREGQQLLVLDVEPLDGEMNFGNLAAIFQWKTGFVDGREQLFVQSQSSIPSPAVTDPAMAVGGTTTNQEMMIPIHSSFRIILTSHQHQSAFGEAVLKIPTLDATIHDSEIQDMLLDKMWNPGLSESTTSSSTSEPTIKLKLALREFTLLSSKAQGLQCQLTKLTQEAAVHGDFQLPEMEKLREQSNANRELRVAMLKKRMEMENEISKTKSRFAHLANVGGAILNSFNATISARGSSISSQLQQRRPPPLAFQLFFPMYFSTLSVSSSGSLNSSRGLVSTPPPILSTALSRSGFTRGGGGGQLSQAPQGVLSRGPPRLTPATTVQQSNVSSLNSTPEALTQMLNLLMPLVSRQNDWYRFILEFVSALEAENQYPQAVKKQPNSVQRGNTVEPISELTQAAGSEVDGNEDSENLAEPSGAEAAKEKAKAAVAASSPSAVYSVETTLMLRKLRRWNFVCSPQELVNTLQELRALEPKRVVLMMINGVANGCRDNGSGPVKPPLMTQLFSPSRPRLERIKIGLTLLPQLTSELCDQMLEFYGVHVKFPREGDDAVPSLVPSSTQHDQQEFEIPLKALQSTISRTNSKHGWLRCISAFPEVAGVLVVSTQSFHSFSFMQRAFFQSIFTKQVRVALLQQLFARSFRTSAELNEVFSLPKTVALSNPALRESEGGTTELSTNPLLLIKDFDGIRKLEMDKSDILETTPLALVNMQRDISPEHWEGLFQVLHRTYQHTTSAAFKRHYGTTTTTNQVEHQQVQNQMTKLKLSQLPSSVSSSSAAPPPNSALTTLRAPTTRRLSTTQSLLHRRSDISLVTMAYPRLLAVVDNWHVLPVHLQKNLLCLYDDGEASSLYNSTASLHQATSFKKCLQSTLLRFACHPCRELLQSALSVDESTKVKAAFAATGGHDPQVLLKSMTELRVPSTWQLLSSLVLFHALLCFQGNLVAVSGPKSYYGFDSFATAVNQLLQTLAQLKNSKEMTKESTFERFLQHAVLGAFWRTTPTGGACEVKFLKHLYRECYNMIDCGAQLNSEVSTAGRGSSCDSSLSVNPPSEGSSRPANITLRRQNSTMRNLMRRTSSSFSVGGNTLLGAPSSPSSPVSSPRTHGPRLAGLATSSVLGFLEFPLESLYLKTSDVDQWFELCWEFAENLEKRHDTQLRKLLTGGSEMSSPGNGETGSGGLPLPPWTSLNSWEESSQFQSETIGTVVTLKEAEECIQNLLNQSAIATQVLLLADSHAADDESGIPNFKSNSSSLVGLIQKAFLDRFNTQVNQIQEFLTNLLHEIRASVHQRSTTDNHISQLSTSEAHASLVSIRKPNIRDQLLTLLRNEIPLKLYQSIGPRERSLAMTPQWLLSDLLAHYQQWRLSLSANHRASDSRSPLWWCWTPALSSAMTIRHIIETAKLSYCANQTLNLEAYSVSYSLHLPVDEESLLDKGTLPPSDGDQDPRHQNQYATMKALLDFPQDTFAVFDGLCVIGATWNAEFGSLEPLQERTEQQQQQQQERVWLLCSLEPNASSNCSGDTPAPLLKDGQDHARQRNSRLLQPKKPTSSHEKRTIPLLVGSGGSAGSNLLVEMELSVGPRGGGSGGGSGDSSSQSLATTPYLTLATPTASSPIATAIERS